MCQRQSQSVLVALNTRRIDLSRLVLAMASVKASGAWLRQFRGVREYRPAERATSLFGLASGVTLVGVDAQRGCSGRGSRQQIPQRWFKSTESSRPNPFRVRRPRRRQPIGPWLTRRQSKRYGWHTNCFLDRYTTGAISPASSQKRTRWRYRIDQVRPHQARPQLASI